MLLKSLPGRSRAGYLNIIVIVIANLNKIFSWENKVFLLNVSLIANFIVIFSQERKGLLIKMLFHYQCY